MLTKKRREMNPILKSLLWNMGVFLALLALAVVSGWLMAKYGF
jgi:hypothetical protein